MMKKTLLFCAVSLAGGAIATPFTGNDAESSAMGNTGVASASPQNAFQFNPGLLADYPDEVDFGLTFPAVKFFIDDSSHLIQNIQDFSDSNAWEDIQNIDAEAFNTAVFGDGGTEDSMADVIADITSNATEISTLTAAIQADIEDNGTIDTPQNVTDLNTEAGLLDSNTNTLDAKVEVANTQSTNLSTATTSTRDGVASLNNRPLQLGLGIDLLNVALPSEKLAMAFSASTSTTIGVAVSISDEDFDPVNALTADLNGVTTEASELTSAMSVLSSKTLELSDHLNDQPQRADYPAGPAGDDEYATALEAWGDELETLSADIDTAQTNVESEQADITNYNGTYISGGEVTPPTFEDMTSTVEVVGANISEVALTAARRFNIYGEEVSIGVTPKIQSINIFEKTFEFETYEDELDSASSDPSGYLTENSTMLYRVNLDLGAAKTWDFHGRARAGLAIKDLIPWTLESNSGTELLIRPKLRIGAAHETKFTKVALDLDLTENKPLKYGVPTRYIGLGGEVNAWGHAALRLGYRNNLSVEDSHVFTGGIGLTPFGTGLDISAWAKPASFDDWTSVVQDAGASVQFKVNF